MKNIQLYIGLFLVIFLFFIAFIGPFLPFVDKKLDRKLFEKDVTGKVTAPPFAPNKEHLFGTDREGHDLLSRIVVGAKETLYYLMVIVMVRYTIAIPLGILAFWYKGMFNIILTVLNYLFSRVPTIFTAVLVINIPFIIFSNNRTIWIIILISIVEVGRVGDIIQKQLQSNSYSPYIQSGTIVGLSSFKLFVRYYLPFLIPQLIVNFVIDLGRTMLLLGQLGLFAIFIAQEWFLTERSIVELKLTSNAWPLLLQDVFKDMRLYPWIPFWATVAMTYTILSFNLLSEGIKNYYLRRFQS